MNSGTLPSSSTEEKPSPRRSAVPQRRSGSPELLRRAGRWLRVVGPGVVTGAAADDPSGIGTYSQAGAAFGTGLLWLALYILPLMKGPPHTPAL